LLPLNQEVTELLQADILSKAVLRLPASSNVQEEANM
jgi:hypothetical protein